MKCSKRLIQVYFFFLSILALDAKKQQSEEFAIGKPAPRVVIPALVWRIENNTQYLHFENAHIWFYINRVEYAPIKQLAFRATLPVIINQKRQGRSSGGFGEIIFTANWRWILHNNFASVLRVGPKLPTTDTSVRPRLGSGSVDAVVEMENVFLSQDWFFSPFIGALITSEHKHIKRGSSFFYNFEFAKRVIVEKKTKLNFFFGLVSNAVYLKPDTINGVKDLNTGGFNQTLGGLFAFSRKNQLVIATLEFPLAQRVFGTQARFDFRARMSYQVFIF